MTRPARTERYSRLNLELPEKLRARIDILMKQCEASSMTEIVRRALTLFDLAISAQAKGGEVVIRAKDKSEKVVMV